MRRILFSAVLCLMVLFLLAGCGGSLSTDDIAATVSNELATTLGLDEQDIEVEIDTVNDSMSESHQMIALMILSGADMDTDPESYDKVYLASVSTKDGSIDSSVVVVVQDGTATTVIPQGLKDLAN